MPKIPPPPPKKEKSKKEKISFPDPDKHEQKTNLHKEIRQTILQLREILPNPKDRDTLLKFAECINPSSSGVDRLPFVSRKPTSIYRNKAACLFALISWMLRKYWDYCAGELSARESIEANLLGLQDVAKKGLNAFVIVGDAAIGYSLAWRK